MARVVVVSVRDSAVSAFSRPFFVPSVGAAVRSFTDEVNRSAPDNPMFAHPDDYELWYLADFDEESGLFLLDELESGKRVLVRGKDVRHG